MSEPQNIDARAVLAEALYNDPATRPKLLNLVREKFPNAPIPELDARDALKREIEPLRKELNDEREALKKERNQRWLESQREAIAPLVGEDNIPHVEKIMTEEGVGTHKAAAELWQARQQVAAPSTLSGIGPMSVPGLHGAGGDDYKDILSNDKWGAQRAHEMIEDFRNGRGQKWSAFAG